MATRAEILERRKKVDDALHHIMLQGEVGPADQKEALGAEYSKLYEIREQLTQEAEATTEATAPANRLPAVQPPAAPGAPRRRKIRWGVVAIGGVGVLSLMGLIGWQLYRMHGKKKARKRRR